MELATDIFPPERFGRVSGSRCGPLVPLKDAKKGMITLAKKLAKERYYQFYDEVSTWEMEHGKLNEPMAHEHFKKYFDKKICKGHSGFEGELAWSTDAEGIDYGVDYKCPTSLEKFNEYLFEGISDYEYNQAQFYMMKRNLSRWYVCPFLAETLRMSDYGLIYPEKEENRMLPIEVLPSDEWREKFWSNLPFVVENRDTYIEILKAKDKLIKATRLKFK